MRSHENTKSRRTQKPNTENTERTEVGSHRRSGAASRRRRSDPLFTDLLPLGFCGCAIPCPPVRVREVRGSACSGRLCDLKTSQSLSDWRLLGWMKINET